MRLDEVDRETMLRAAITKASHRVRRGRPLWALVRDICCVGSNSAGQICCELGWNPDADAARQLPPRAPRSSEGG